MEPLVLVVNPGSASRKYALFRGDRLVAALHFEWEDGQICCTATVDGHHERVPTRGIQHLDQAASAVVSQLQMIGALGSDEALSAAAVRIVAPSGYFLEDRAVTSEALEQLRAVAAKAPLHIAGALGEIDTLQALMPTLPLVMVSDSSFHRAKPDYAWNYGIDLDVADAHEIKRFGYHGISAEAASRSVSNLTGADRIIICHLGSGSSVTAVQGGRSLDNTMGYSPLEGLVMSVRSGSIDPMAVEQLQRALGMDSGQIVQWLIRDSGLRGISGISDDIRVLLNEEAAGNYRAELAIAMYIYGVRKAIGQMSAVLGGVDALVFTATIGERSAILRGRIMDGLDYLDLSLDQDVNAAATDITSITAIHAWQSSKPILIVPADEASEIARHARQFLS